VTFNDSAFGPRLDYDALARVFMEPTADMPAELVDGLHLVHEMGRARHVESMLEEARKNGLNLDLEPDATPEDVAVKMLLLDPCALQNQQNCNVIARPRTFEFFGADTLTAPRFDGPNLDQMRVLQRRLEAFYAAWQRGPGTRVFSYCRENFGCDSTEWWFLVRHGALPRREEAMERGEPTCVFFRPRTYAVLRYDTRRGEMGVYCSADRERKLLLRVFGKTLFGRDDFFPCRAKYDLSAAVRDGRAILACADVPGIEGVSLTGLEIFEREDPWRRTLYQAPDIFRLIERDEVRWPKKLEHIASATFAVKFWRQKRPRRVTIMPSNRAMYRRDEDSAILERWMEARRLIRTLAA
jgi:hypothetical protein